MTLIEAYNSFRRWQDRESLLSRDACQWGGEDPWALACTWMAAVVDRIETAQTDYDLDEAVREYWIRQVAGTLPDRASQIELLQAIAGKIEPSVRNLPSVN